ncbi:MAG TPA: VTT domain-containing protein [Candidatus Paceibacterota bacterium]
MKLEKQKLEEQYESEVTSIVQKCADLLRSKYGLWFLGATSFADAALALPIIVDPFMVAYIVANRKKALLGVTVTILASVLGGVATYLFAAFFIDQILHFFSPEMSESFYHVITIFDQGTFALAFLGALTPVPYTLVAAVAGVLKGSLVMFILGSVAGRIIRFGIVGYFTYQFGDVALQIAKNHLKIVSVLSVLAVLAYIFYKVL